MLCSNDHWRDDEKRSINGHSDSERGDRSSAGRSDSWGSSYRTSASFSSGLHSKDDDLEENSLTSANQEEQHRKFVARRKQHYNMRDALRR